MGGPIWALLVLKDQLQNVLNTRGQYLAESTGNNAQITLVFIAIYIKVTVGYINGRHVVHECFSGCQKATFPALMLFWIFLILQKRIFRLLSIWLYFLFLHSYCVLCQIATCHSPYKDRMGEHRRKNPSQRRAQHRQRRPCTGTSSKTGKKTTNTSSVDIEGLCLSYIEKGLLTDAASLAPIGYSIAGEVASPLFSHVKKFIPLVQFTDSHDGLDLHNETSMCRPIPMSFGCNLGLPVRQ